MQTPSALPFRPLYRLISSVKAWRRSAPTDQRQPLTLGIEDDVPELLANEVSTLEAVAVANRTVPLGFLLIGGQYQLEFIQDRRLAAFRTSVTLTHLMHRSRFSMHTQVLGVLLMSRMKNSRISIFASIVFMLLAWLGLTEVILYALTDALVKDATGYTILGFVVLAWVFVPVQIVRYCSNYRRQQ